MYVIHLNLFNLMFSGPEFFQIHVPVILIEGSLTVSNLTDL